jgi:hypothetical protein
MTGTTEFKEVVGAAGRIIALPVEQVPAVLRTNECSQEYRAHIQVPTTCSRGQNKVLPHFRCRDMNLMI